MQDATPPGGKKSPSAKARRKPKSKTAQRMDALEAELAQAKEQGLRLLAELDNTRKRADKERADAQTYGARDLAQDLLSVADNLERAIAAANLPGADLPGLLEGVQATQRELVDAFKRHGITAFDPKGDIFDPNFHEAMFEAEHAEHQAGTIIEVVSVGYRMHERLLRPARVGVAKAKP